MSFILALDEGTTSARALLFDHAGHVVGSAQREFEQRFPSPGLVEHDPLEIWNTQTGVMHEALAAAECGPAEVAAIGITNQRETTVVWDRDSGLPIYNAIVWQDRRTATECDRLKAEGCDAMIREKTGLVLDAYFSATKIAWILEHVPRARDRAKAGHLAFGTIDTWLIWNLTRGSVHAVEISNAARTLLFNIHHQEWDEELLDIFGVPRAMLPEVRGSSEVYAETSSPHVPIRAPIAGISGDQQAALFGQMCHRRGLAKNTYGTGCFMLLHTGHKPTASACQLLTTIAWMIGDRVEYALEGSVFVGGAAVQWLRDGLGLINQSADVEPLARSVDDNGGVFLVPAFVGLGAPHWDPEARGLLIGLTRGTTAGHVARATLEGIAFQIADVLDSMKADSGLTIQELRVDGGGAVNDLLLQFQADLLDLPVVRPRVTETTALGAAALAGLAVKFWKNTEDIQSVWSADRTFEPQMSRDRVNDLRSRWHEAVHRAKAWAGPSA